MFRLIAVEMRRHLTSQMSSLSRFLVLILIDAAVYLDLVFRSSSTIGIQTWAEEPTGTHTMGRGALTASRTGSGFAGLALCKKGA